MRVLLRLRIVVRFQKHSKLVLLKKSPVSSFVSSSPPPLCPLCLCSQSRAVRGREKGNLCLVSPLRLVSDQVHFALGSHRFHRREWRSLSRQTVTLRSPRPSLDRPSHPVRHQRKVDKLDPHLEISRPARAPCLAIQAPIDEIDPPPPRQGRHYPLSPLLSS